FAHKPDILEVVKWYVHHQLIINKFSTAKRNYDGITMFIKLVDECMPDLESFSGVSQELLIMYFEYLMNTKSEMIGKLISKKSIKKGALVIRDVINKGTTKEWYIPGNVSYVRRIYKDMIIHNKRLKDKANNINKIYK